ncbi:uncharacterized protein [Nicotiana sylvestris]|uniref:uncharacterized protein n=1 Tax=Nicotiana sylvestris TaxID=4096 RepID=UPI00388C6821
MVGEKVLLKVSPMMGVMRFGKKGKLSPQFIGLFELDGDLTYDVEPVAILDRHVRKLRLEDIVSVKVKWRGQPVEEATWDTEQEMQSRYPHQFETPGMFLDPFEDQRLFKRGMI